MKKERSQMILEFDADDGCAILYYQMFLKKHVDLSNKIPARVLRKFFNYFTVQNERLRAEGKAICDSIKVKILERYSKQEEYLFKLSLVTKMQPPDFAGENIPFKQECSFEGLIDYVMSALSANFTDSRKSKKEMIVTLYRYINNYFFDFEEDAEKIFGTYKRSVLTGYIAHCFGYHLSKELINDKEPTNESLFHGVKYYVSQINKKSTE